MNDCIFCNIVQKKAPAKIVYEDDRVLALIPIDQVAKGHTLLIPKQHFVNIFDIDQEILSHLASILKDLACKIVKENNASAVNLLNASGRDAQQSIFHYHFHIVPRYSNDNLDMWIKQKL